MKQPHSPEQRLARLIRDELTQSFAYRKEELHRLDKSTGDEPAAFFGAMLQLAHNLEQSAARVRLLANSYAQNKLQEAGE